MPVVLLDLRPFGNDQSFVAATNEQPKVVLWIVGFQIVGPGFGNDADGKSCSVDAPCWKISSSGVDSKVD